MAMIETITETAAETGLLTAEDLLRLSGEGVRGELIRGVLHETMSTGKKHGKVVGHLVYHLQSFVIPRGLGSVIASDSGVLLERDPDTVREPDIGFTSAEREPPDAWDDGYSELVPDLVVEIVSPSDTRREVHEKALMWLSHGARLVWVVVPDSRTVDVYLPDGDVIALGEDDTLDGLDVLPGFRCPVRAAFEPRLAQGQA